MSWTPVLAPLLVLAATTTGAPPNGVAPATGRYTATLCVAVAAQPMSCGPALVRVLPDRELHVQVQDIGYHLAFDDKLVVGVTTHGAMQVAEFASTYRWQGQQLQFSDGPRGLRYELTLTTKER